jgi:hypothetical protein
MDALVPILPNPESALAQLLYPGMTRIPTHETGTGEVGRVPGKSTAAVRAVLDVEIEDSFEPSGATHARSVSCSAGYRDGEREQCAGRASEPWRRIKGPHDAIRMQA